MNLGYKSKTKVERQQLDEAQLGAAVRWSHCKYMFLCGKY